MGDHFQVLRCLKGHVPFGVGGPTTPGSLGCLKVHVCYTCLMCLLCVWKQSRLAWLPIVSDAGLPWESHRYRGPESAEALAKFNKICKERSHEGRSGQVFGPAQDLAVACSAVSGVYIYIYKFTCIYISYIIYYICSYICIYIYVYIYVAWC